MFYKDIQPTKILPAKLLHQKVQVTISDCKIPNSPMVNFN